MKIIKKIIINSQWLKLSYKFIFMKKLTLVLSALFMVIGLESKAQEKFIASSNKGQKTKALNQDYLQIQKTNLKSEENWWQPDTVLHICEPDNRNLQVIYSYNNFGYVLKILYQVRENNIWNDLKQYIYEYDSKNKLLSETYQEYDNGWITDYKDTFKYDSKNNLTEWLSEVWRDNNWINSEKYVYEYNAMNNLLSELYIDWSRQNNEWENIDIFIFTYDDNNNVLTELYKEWENDAWKNNYKNTYTYNEIDDRIETELWENFYNNQWNYSYKGFFSYNEKNLLIQYLQKQWRNGAWGDRYREQYEYDDNDNKTSITVSSFKSNDEVWEDSRKYLYSYNTHDNILSYIELYWENENWLNWKKELYEYDDGDLIYTEHQKGDGLEWINNWMFVFFYDDNHNCISGETYSYSFESGIWQSSNINFEVLYNNNQSTYKTKRNCYNLKLSYSKTPKPAGIEEIEPSTSEITIYPNPSKDYINISVENAEIKNVQIYNLTGKLVKQEKSNKININDLPVGMYIIKVETEAGNCIKKVIKD
jgi:hypothetical protein